MGADSDVFSLGVVMYQMATGKLPFGGETAMEMLHNILRTDPAGAGQLNKRIHPELERIISKTMEKDPNRRYGSATELVHDLKNLQQQIQFGISADSMRSIIGLPKHVTRSILFALLIAVVAAGLYLWLGQSKPIDSIAILPICKCKWRYRSRILERWNYRKRDQ